MEDNTSKAWYRKYRPKTIDDYIGENIKKIVNAQFTIPENRPNVILISGDRGCGKTTFARLISKYYHCLSPLENGQPCEECEACQTINSTLIDGDATDSFDGVIEVDATTANTKEQIQNIIEDALTPPLYGDYKVLILDECHMITPAAQNSLLKVIEDIPSHLIVIFATTDSDKLLGTIKSRCQLKLTVTKKTIKEMSDRLLEIAKMEKLSVETGALEMIAKNQDRVPRECINKLEAIAKSNNNQITIQAVRESIGNVDSSIYARFFIAANSGLEEIMVFNEWLKENNVNYKDFLKGLTDFVLNCVKLRMGLNLKMFDDEYIKQANKIFKLYSVSEIDLLLQLLEYYTSEVRNSDTEYELALTTFAMKIGKIGILNTELNNEAKRAEKENHDSIMKYKEKKEEERLVKIDELEKKKIDQAKVSELFKQARVIKTSKDS